MNPAAWQKWTTRVAAVVATLGLTVSAAGCIEPPADINRVQPNYLSKSIFEGEWYTRQLIVDKQFHTSYPFVGYEGDLDRVRFEITEGALIATRSYEKVPGTEPGNAGEQSVVAVFPIQKHFDIRREYNPVNGAESNVIVENDYDRPWWERDFIRVDWSTNRVDDFDLNGAIMSFTAAKLSDNANSDPKNPWKIRHEDSDGDGRVDYLETTIDAFAEPNIYACVLSAGDWANNCHGANIKLKVSFMKVDYENDYEALDYPDFAPIEFGCRLNAAQTRIEICFEGDTGCVGCSCLDSCSGSADECQAQCEDAGAELEEVWLADSPTGTEFCDPAYHNPDNCWQQTIDVFGKFGYFRTDRYFKDRENGYTLEGREQLINRWNIWERSVDDSGARLPYDQREPKPVVFYTNVQFPEALLPSLQEMADDWDNALRDTVAKLQNKSIEDVPRMYEARLNDCSVPKVEAYIDEHAELHDFRGDLSAAGIGEVAFGNLEQACAVLEHHGRLLQPKLTDEEAKDFKVFRWQQLGDLRYSFLNWSNKAEVAGPLGYGPSAADPLTGEIISANANIYGASLDTYANWGGDIVQLLNGEITSDDLINGTHIREHVEAVRTRYGEDMSQRDIGRFLQLFDSRTNHMSDSRYLQEVPVSSVNAGLDKLAKTGFEDEHMIDASSMLLFGGADPSEISGGTVPESVKARARPSTWARQDVPSAFRFDRPQDKKMTELMSDKMSANERFQQKMEFFGRQNLCYTAEMVEPAVADLAYELRGKPRDEVVHYIRASIFRAVMAHEVGHTMGLRHNFEGSADALNYFPGWWGVETDDHRDSHNGRKHELGYSSIMDYHQRFNSDFAGLGLWDKAAIKFGYGQLVEVFDEGRFDPAINGYEDPFVPRHWRTNLNLFYPNDLPYLLAGGDTNTKLNDHYDEVYNQQQGGDPNVFMDVKSESLNIQPRPQNLFKRKDIPFDEFKKERAKSVFFNPNNAAAVAPLTEVPYKYCSDSYAWGGNLTCNRYDMGATSEEIVRNAAEMYEFYYPFNAFRGQKLWTSDPVGGYMGRLYDRTYQPMLNAFRYFYYYRRSTASMWPLIRDWSAASYVGLNFFGRVLQTPEPGEYCMSDGWSVPVSDAERNGGCDEGDTFTLGLGPARYYDTKWNDEIAFRPNHIGHIYDKLLAIQSMTTSNAFFLRDFSSFFNRGAFSIGYYRVFQPEMIRLFGGLLSQNRDAYAPRVHINGKPTVVYTPVVQLPGAEFSEIGTRLKPTDSYMTRYYAMFFGMANLTSNVDLTLDFSTRSRISMLGGSNDPVLDGSAGVPEIVWKDPLTNYVYRALAPDGEDLSIGYGLLADAAAFTNDGSDGEPEGAWHQAKRELGESEAALALAVDEGEPTEELELAVEDAEMALTRLNRTLNGKVQIIDAVRQLSDALEFSL